MACTAHSDVLWRTHAQLPMSTQQRCSVKGCCEGCWPRTGLIGWLCTVIVLLWMIPAVLWWLVHLCILGEPTPEGSPQPKRWNSSSHDWVWPLPDVFVKRDTFYRHSSWCPCHLVAPWAFCDCYLSLDLKKLKYLLFLSLSDYLHNL